MFLDKGGPFLKPISSFRCERELSPPVNPFILKILIQTVAFSLPSEYRDFCQAKVTPNSPLSYSLSAAVPPQNE